jgi:hypothetical protein
MVEPFTAGADVDGTLTASSVTTVEGDVAPPQLVQGATTARVGRAKIGRYDVRLWLQPAVIAGASNSTATAHKRGNRESIAVMRGTVMRISLPG